MGKPSGNLRKILMSVPCSDGDALPIVNTFYTREDSASDWDVTSEYWQSMVCTLAHRVAIAEKNLAEVTAAYHRLDRKVRHGCTDALCEECDR